MSYNSVHSIRAKMFRVFCEKKIKKWDFCDICGFIEEKH